MRRTEGGLVDMSRELYFEFLVGLKQEWNDMEKALGRDLPKFSSYFAAEKEKKIADCYLAEVRKKAGAGDPPGRMTNNDSEIANLMVKQHQNFLQLSIQEGIPNMQKFIEHQTEIRKRAMFSLDPSAVRMKEGSLFKKNPRDFDRSSKSEILRHVQRLFPSASTLVLEPGTPKPDGDDTLSVHPADSRIRFFLPENLKKVFQRARKLISTNALAQMGDSVVVKDNHRFFEIFQEMDSFYRCGKGVSRCQQFFQEFNGLFCAHTLAAAEWNESLVPALDTIRQRQQRTHTNVILHQAKHHLSGQKSAVEGRGRRPPRLPIGDMTHAFAELDDVQGSQISDACSATVGSQQTYQKPSQQAILSLTSNAGRPGVRNYWETDTPFLLVHVSWLRLKKSKFSKCLVCSKPFSERDAPPEDLCIVHMNEPWLKGGSFIPGRGANVPVCPTYQCVMQRYPKCFYIDALKLEEELELSQVHKDHLRDQFGVEV